MPANLDLLNAFTDAITGESVALDYQGQRLEVPKAQFAAAFHELGELRAAALDSSAEWLQGVAERLTDLVAAAEAQDAAAIPTELVAALLEEDEDEEEEDGYAPAMVDTVTALLQSLNPNADAGTAHAFLDAMSLATRQAQEPAGRHRAPEPDYDDTEYDDYEQEQPQQLFQPVTPRRAPRQALPVAPQRVGPRPRARQVNGAPPMRRPRAQAVPQHAIHRILPASGIPTPANPPPFQAVPPEQVLGLRRSPSGRYDAGSLES